MEGAKHQDICLQVFGRVAAAISHELKNTLSIINENAGLLDDLTLLAENGDGVEARRVKDAAAIIMRQVARSNIILKDLSRFAHSGDAPVVRADIGDILALMVALTARQAAGKKLVVEVDCPAGLLVETDLMALEALVFLVLCRIYGASAEGGRVHVAVGAAPPHAALRFSPAQGGPAAEVIAGDEEGILAARIGARCFAEDRSLHILMPVC